MTVEHLAKTPGFSAAALPCPEREINGAYSGDLLSWVMSKADSDNAWITIMSNVNVIAVATLTDVSCVILAEGVSPNEELVSLSCSKNVNLLTTELSAYECAITLGKMI